MRINCLVADDEPLAREVIADYVEACPELKLSGICSDALQAGEVLNQQNVDLLLLDINMPKLSGIGFIKSLKEPPLCIFISAYPEYAVEGFEVDAVDYLLKPVTFERFRIAVNRALERLSPAEKKVQSEHLIVRADRKNYRIHFHELLYLEAQGDYVRFVTSEISLMVHGKLKEFLTLLPENLFCQIHKSFVIALDKIIYTEGNQVKIGTEMLPVSLSFKDNFLKKLHI